MIFLEETKEDLCTKINNKPNGNINNSNNSMAVNIVNITFDYYCIYEYFMFYHINIKII